MLSQYFDSSGVLALAGERAEAATIPPSELVDERALDNIRSIESRGSNSLLRTVFENFKVDAVEKLHELRAAIGDDSSLVAGAHAIKSMSLSMGAKALSEYSRTCETQWKQGEIGEAPQQIEELARHVRDAVEALEQLLQTDDAES